MNIKEGDKVLIVGNGGIFRHHFKLGDIVEVLDVNGSNGNVWASLDRMTQTLATNHWEYTGNMRSYKIRPQEV